MSWSSYTSLAGDSLLPIRQKMQSADIVLLARRLFVQPHDKRCKAFLGAEPVGQLARRVFTGHATHAHAVEQPVRRIIREDEDGLVALPKLVAQALRILAGKKRAHLHGEVAGGYRRRAGEQLESHAHHARGYHI